MLIAVAIGIGIYGSMNNLFRPHVYAECSLKDNPTKTASFYVNERENYLIIYNQVFPNGMVGGPLRYDLMDTEGGRLYGWETQQISYFPSETFGYSFRMIFFFPDGTWAGDSTYTNCKVTRQFLKKGFDEMYKT